MQRNIWIPKEEYDQIKKAAESATTTKGLGAYFVKLHKEESKRKARRES